MTGIAKRLQAYLDEHGVAYEAVHHREDFRARTTAEDTQTPAGAFAKTIFVRVDDAYAMAIVPANGLVSERKLREALGARQVHLAQEDETQELCPDCEIGAAPPFGNLYGLPVYVSPEIAQQDRITFNAGTHEDALRMAYVDFARCVQPLQVDLMRAP